MEAYCRTWCKKHQKLTRGVTELQMRSDQCLVLPGTAQVHVRFETKYFVLHLLVMGVRAVTVFNEIGSMRYQFVWEVFFML